MNGYEDEIERRTEIKRWAISASLFLLTLISTTFAGIMSAAPYSQELIDEFGRNGLYLAGLKFSIPLMLIIGAHESGHYIAARLYRLRASPPYFLPAPFINPFGTMGAFIRLKDRLENKKMLFDVGAAGPFAGFVVALPCLIYGVANSRVVEFNPQPGEVVFIEGDSILYFALKFAFHGELTGNMDILTHPVAMAGWFGMLITALNLLPVSQLDGGHISYSLLGRRAHDISAFVYQAFWAVGLAGVINRVLVEIDILQGNEYLDVLMGYVFFALLIKFIGVRHPSVIDEEDALDKTRIILAAAAFIILLLCFTPIPLRISGADAIQM